MLVDGLPGPSGQIPDHGLGQSLTCLAVAPGVRRDRAEAVIVPVPLELLDGFVAGMIARRHPGEGQAQGDPGSIDPVSPAMMASTTGRLDGWAREEIEERGAVVLAEPITSGME